MKILCFTLAGLLASYGENSRWDHRSSADMPTKSAVIGIMGCCMGLGRQDPRLAEMDSGLHMAVLRERAGRIMTDFHTVSGPGGVILNAEHKPRGGGTIITPKQYLQDASFRVFLYGDEGLLDKCQRAMRKPKWVAYLGRRSCPPSVPLVPEMQDADSVEQAMEARRAQSIPGRDEWMLWETELTASGPIHSQSREAVRRDGVILASTNLYYHRNVRVRSVKAGDTSCT